MRKKMFFLWLAFSVVLAFSTWTQAKTTEPQSLAVIDFSELGNVSRGAGKTLSIALYSSLKSKRMKLMDPSLVQQLLSKNHRSVLRLSKEVLASLKKEGVAFVITGSISYLYKTFLVTYRLVDMSGRVLHSEILPPVRNWGTVLSSLQYSVSLLMRESTNQSNPRAKKSLSSLKKKMIQLIKGKKKKRTTLKKYADLLKDTKKIDGLLPIHWKILPNGEKKYYVAISPTHLKQRFLFSPTLESGTGGMLLPFAMMDEFPFYFQKEENKLFVFKKNTLFRKPRSKVRQRTFQKSFSDGMLFSVKILSEPDPKTGEILVDLEGLFKRNLTGMGSKKRKGVSAYLSFQDSSFTQLQNYPKNLELGVRVFFRAFRSIAIPSQTMAPLLLRYSISLLEKNNYMPRLSDDRVGHFMTVMKKFDSDQVDTRFVRYINRWHLEKADPTQALSKPKKPIVYWLDNNIPEEYRQAVREGVLLWNKAFEKIGFQDAIEVKQQPDDAKWDGADIRYNTIRWFFADKAGFAQGPSRVNPFTGEIFDADIRVAGGMMMFISSQYKYVIEPMAWAKDLGLFPTEATKNSHLSKQWIQDWLKNTYKKPEETKEKQHTSCDYAKHAVHQAALGWNFLGKDGSLDPHSPKAKKYIRDFIVSLIAHEVGHTLGLRHNFKASAMLSKKELQNPKITSQKGITNSVMEYTPVNLALPGEKQGEYWQTTLGPYDHWAIEYAYKTIQAKTPKEELPVLQKIASRNHEPQLQYGTDEDAYGSASILSVDPYSSRFDLGSDPMQYYKDRVRLAQLMWKNLDNTWGKKLRYQKTRSLFNMGLSITFRSGLYASKFLGGLHHVRDHIDSKSKRLPFRPVPAQKQRESLQFIAETFFSKDLFQWSPDLLNKLAPERQRGFSWGTIWNRQLDFPISRMVHFMQTMMLLRVMHPVLLQRIQDTQLRLKTQADYVSVFELFSTLTSAIWGEFKPSPASAPVQKSSISPWIQTKNQRRSLQWQHLQLLIAYDSFHGRVLQSNSDLLLTIRQQLLQIKKWLQQSQPKTKGLTLSHAQLCLVRIQQWEKLQLSRNQ